MNFVPVTCPTCGGELMLPKNQKQAICSYCGNKFLLEKNKKDEVTPSVENWLNLGWDALKSGSHQNAHIYFSKILEVDFMNEDAWFGKGIASGYLRNPLEMQQSFEQAINYISEDDSDLRLEIEQKYEDILIYLYNQNFELFRKSGLTINDCHMLASFTVDWLNYASDCIENFSLKTKHFPLFDLMVKAIRKILRNTNYLDENKKGRKYHANVNIRNQLENYYKFTVRKRQEIDPMYKPPSEWCFIASATYNNLNHPNVVFLRNFRDDCLLTSKLGSFIVKLYYSISPPIANLIENHNLLKSLSHLLLINPIIRFIKIFYKI